MKEKSVYSEEMHRVGKCLHGKCTRDSISIDDVNKKKGKPSNILSFFSASSDSQAKSKNQTTDGKKTGDTISDLGDTARPKYVKIDGEKRTIPSISTVEDIGASNMKKPKVVKHDYDGKAAESIITHFRKIFPGLDPTQIHNFHVCQQHNCREISSTGLRVMTKDNKFQHKWLFDPQHAYCEKTNTWNLVYIDGKGMFCGSCRGFDTKQPKNGGKQWNSEPNVRCRTETIKGHFSSNMHSEAVAAKARLSSSFFDAAEKSE